MCQVVLWLRFLLIVSHQEHIAESRSGNYLIQCSVLQTVKGALNADAFYKNVYLTHLDARLLFDPVFDVAHGI